MGQYLTATATDANGNTSEFSPAQQIIAGSVSDLALTLVDSPDPATLTGDPSDTITYTLTVTNNGPDDATNVRITDLLPTSVTYVSSMITTGTGSTMQAGGSIIATFPTLARNEQGIVQIKVIPTQTGVITNTASVASNDIDPDTGNNMASANTTVTIPADLSVNVASKPNPVIVGDDLNYQITVVNNGPGSATGVTLTVQLSSDASLVNASAFQGTYTQNGNTIIFKLGTIPSGVPVAARVIVQPGSDVLSTSVDVSVDSVEIDPNSTNDAKHLDVAVQPASDLVVSLVNPPIYVLSSDPNGVLNTLTYTLNVLNLGPSEATDVVVDLQLPPGVTVTSSPSGYDPVNSTVALGSLPVDQSTQIVIQAVVDSSTAAGMLPFSAAVRSSLEDTDTTNNTAEVITRVDPSDLSVAFVNPPARGTIGQDLTYQILVANNDSGAVRASSESSRLTLVLPKQATFVSLKRAGQSLNLTPDPNTNALTIDLGAMVVTGTDTLTLVVRPTSSVFLKTTANITSTSDQFDPVSTNNQATANTPVNPADLQVIMSRPAGHSPSVRT